MTELSLHLHDADATAQDLDELTIALRTDLLCVPEVASVRPRSAGAPPMGARAALPAEVGALVVACQAGIAALKAIVGVAEAWIGERSSRKVELDIDGKHIVLTGATHASERRALDAWMAATAADHGTAAPSVSPSGGDPSPLPEPHQREPFSRTVPTS